MIGPPRPGPRSEILNSGTDIVASFHPKGGTSAPYRIRSPGAAPRRAVWSRPSQRGSGYDEAQPCAAHAEHDDEGHEPSGRGAGDQEAVRKAPSHAMGQQHRSTAGGEMRKDKEGGKAIMRH